MTVRRKTWSLQISGHYGQRMMYTRKTPICLFRKAEWRERRFSRAADLDGRIKLCARYRRIANPPQDAILPHFGCMLFQGKAREDRGGVYCKF
jgi:hypothetical protein